MKPGRKTDFPGTRVPSGHNAFTFVELLVVVGIIGLLSVMLLPALAAPKSNSNAAQCLNNQRQLALGWIMYQGDNLDSLMSPGAVIDQTLNYMDWSSSGKNTNTSGLVGPTALMSTYVKTAAVYKCPADKYPWASNPGPRTRSVSMNAEGLGGSQVTPFQDGVNYVSAKKAVDLNKPGPARIWVWLDEHADSIDDAQYYFDPGQTAGNQVFRNVPASYHNFAGSLSFADGHAVIHQWVETGILPVKPQTVFPVRYLSWVKPAGQNNHDWQYLNSGMPFR